MAKINAGLIVFSILAALVLGLLIAGIVTQRDDDVLAAIAAQERAKAAKLEAEAETAQALADQAQTEAQAKAEALPAIAEGKRWVALGAGIATVIVLIGLAFDVVLWIGLRAIVLYPNAQGHWPIVPGKEGWELPGLANGPAPLQIGTQAQAAATMIGIATVSPQPVADVAQRMRSSAQALPAPTFDQPTGDGLQLVYVKNGQQSKAQREIQDIGEFIRRASEVGLARSYWIGKNFSGTGNRCTRSYYDAMMARLDSAGVVESAGGKWAMAVELAEALDAFGLAHDD